MNKRTKLVAGVAGVLFVVATVVVWLGLREISALSNELSIQIEAIQKDRAQQEVFTQIQRISADSQTNRDTLESYFIKSQSDSIDFLNFIEDQGLQAGVELQTLTPQEVDKGSNTYLSVPYDISGSLVQVEKFIKQLENIPYVSQLQSIYLTQRTSGVWQAEVSIDVQILNYEE